MTQSISNMSNNRIVIGIIGVILGFIVGIIVMKTFFNEDSSVIEQLKKDEEKKRDILFKQIDSIILKENILKMKIDSTSKANDSILIVKETQYKERIIKISKKKDEEINRINTVDSAYIDILSR